MAADATARVTPRAARAALLHGIYLIVNDGPQAESIALAGVEAGIRIVQYRAKSGIVPERLRVLRALTRERHALLLCNDDWRAALAFDCDGVHLGPDDAGFSDVAPVRTALRERLIGLSCGTLEEMRAANELDVDYAGVGSVFATASKTDAGDPIGIAGLQRIAALTHLPVAAIGGIDIANVGAVRGSGVAMAAVISAVANAEDPNVAARRLRDAWNAGT